MALLAFLHTSQENRSLVAGRLRRSGFARHVVHRVDETLLSGEWETLEDRDRAVANAIVRLGRLGVDRVICTCTTIGAAAEAAGRRQGIDVTRADRPLMRAAAARGGRIAVVIASPASRSASLALLHEELGHASAHGRVTPIDVPAAWTNFTAGRHDLYLEQIRAAAGDGLIDNEQVVLAELSMSPAAADLGPRVLTPLEFLMGDVLEFIAT